MVRSIFVFYVSLSPAASVYAYYVSRNVKIRVSDAEARLFILVLCTLIAIAMLRTLFHLIRLPEKGVTFPLYVLGVTSCVGMPFIFAAVYRIFERTGVCIQGFSGGYDDLHFSYVTLTTLGYGDLTPVGHCRIFSAIESIIGYFCLGILVSVGLSIYLEESERARAERQNELDKHMDEMFERHWKEIKASTSQDEGAGSGKG